NDLGGIFIAAYDTAGNYLWAKTPNMSFNGATDEVGYAVTIDGTGNVYFTGKCNSPVFFGGSQILSGGQASFVASVTSSGTYRWAKRSSGAGSAGNWIACDTLGHVVTTGYVSNGTVYFDGTTAPVGGSVSTTFGTSAPFIAQFFK